MRFVSDLNNAFWILAIGIVALFVMLVALGAFAPGEVWAVTIAVIVLALLLAAHFLHMRHVLKREGPNQPRREVNAMRERRGF